MSTLISIAKGGTDTELAMTEIEMATYLRSNIKTVNITKAISYLRRNIRLEILTQRLMEL